MKNVEVISKVVNRDKAGQPVTSVAPAVNLSNYVNITGMQEITGEKNFAGGLKVNGCPIVYDATNKFWKLEGDLLVTGGVTMYGNDSDFVASTIMDAILYDDTTLGINSQGQLYVKGSVGGATTLGSLSNVGSWADSVAPQDRIMYQAANSSQWVSKNLSDLAVGGVTGDYLPLSGGTINGSGDYLYVPLYINALNNQISGITFKTNGAERGHVGYSSGLGIRLHSSTTAGISVSDSDEPIFYTADGAIKNTIWHAGNDGSGSGLDADMLDGLDATAFFCDKGASNSFDDKIYNGTYRTSSFTPNNAYGYGLVASFRSMETCAQIYFPDGNREPQFRMQWNSQTSITNGWTALITSGSIGNYNAGSATKLQTARTIWGQSFDGTGNVSGTLYLGNNTPINANNSSGTSYNILNFNQGNALILGYGTAAAGYGTYIDGHEVFIRYGTSRTTGLTLNSSGNVGIGTTNPSDKLHIVGDVNIAKPSTLNQASLSFMNTSSDLWQISGRFNKNNSAENDRLNFYYYNGTTWSNIMTLYNNGNMLVSGGITMYSARKLKTIQDERGLSLEELSVIKPTRFTWKDGRDDKVHIGGIADDVMKVLPEVIYKADNDTLTMDYGNAAFAIAASLIKPVVNHEERIKVLEEENKRLKEEVEQLKWIIA